MEIIVAGKPGRSGRKRHGAERKVNFNTKIDPGLRDELQSAADAANRSLSREVELRLQNSLVPAGKVEDATRALCLLIVEAAKKTSEGRRNWTNDHNFQIAFTRAVDLIIDMTSAAGHPRRAATQGAPFVHPLFENPEDLARDVVMRIGNDLIEAKSEPYARALRALGNPAKWLKKTRECWKQWTIATYSINSGELKTQISRLIKNRGYVIYSWEDTTGLLMKHLSAKDSKEGE